MHFKTSDGYTFYLLRDGRVADSKIEGNIDMSWPDLDSFLLSLADDDESVKIVLPAEDRTFFGVLTWRGSE
jgi:hypothetical protein